MDIAIKKQAREAIETLSDKKARVALDFINYSEKVRNGGRLLNFFLTKNF